MNNRKKKCVGLSLGFVFFFSLCQSLYSQAFVFEQKTGEDNPLENVTTVSSAISSPVDIDNDGDFDMFVGDATGVVFFYKNIGTEENPNLLEEQTGALNPLNAVNLEGKVFPVFVDIDGDTDLDVFLGGKNKIYFYKNTGSITNPVFEEQLAENNPLNSVENVGDMGFFTSFVDIDFDYDLDVFIGFIDFNINDSQGILFYKNNGTGLIPDFEKQEGENNPFQEFDELYPIPTFVDIDGDSDLDVFIEKGNGNYLFYENTTETEVVGVDELYIDRVSMYPNPAKTNVNFNLIDDETATVRLFSISGLELYRTQITKEKRTIDISSFDAGIYLVMIETGTLKITKKLVVKN